MEEGSHLPKLLSSLTTAQAPARPKAAKLKDTTGALCMVVRDFFLPYIAYMQMDGRAEKTVQEHKRFIYNVIDQTIGSTEVGELLMTDLSRIRERAEHYGKHGPQRAIIVTRRLLTYIRHAGHRLEFDPYEYRLPKAPIRRPQYLPKEDLAKLRAYLELSACLYNVRARALIELLLSTGARIGEVLPLNRGDVDFEKKEIQIENVKTHNEETLYPTATACYWIQEYLKRRRDDCPALFVSGRARMLRVTSGYRLAEIGRRAGLSVRLNHKILRATYATYLLDGGAKIHDVQMLARHKSERTTLRYYAAHDTKRAVEVHRKVMELV